MELNLNLGLPLCPPPLSVDLGYDLALNDLPFSSSEIDDVLTRLPSIDVLHQFDGIRDPENFEPFDLPPYNDIPLPPTSSEDRRINALNSMPYSASLMFNNEPLARTGGPTLRRELFDYPEFRFRRLFESRHRWEMARTRSNREESGLSTHPATDPDRLVCDIRRSGRLVGSVGKHKANEKSPQVDTSTEEKKEKNGSASDFDCAICFEVAKEPVVTSCGHLFCWPCLYQWLHIHCDYKECPVCKGKVNESNVVPIYGRGSSEASREWKNAEDGHQGLKIPPRPQGNRVESLRQQLQSPALFQRSESWIQEMQELLSERIRMLQREVIRNPPSPPTNSPSIPPVTAASLLENGTVSHRQILLQASTPVPSSVATELLNATRRRERPMTITLSNDVHDPAPSPSQVATSSTLAMIQGEAAVPDSSLELNWGGTSMVLRRRTRSRSSSGVNDGVSYLRQRRRMN